MFTKKTGEPTACTQPEIIVVTDETDSDDEDDKIEASLKQLFPGKHEVSAFKGKKQMKTYWA